MEKKYKRGDVNEQGKFFFAYYKSRSGQLKEQWYTEDKFKERMSKTSTWHKNHHLVVGPEKNRKTRERVKGLLSNSETKKIFLEGKKLSVDKYLESHVYEVTTRDLLGGAKRRAKEKGIEFSITKEDIIIPKICPALGIDVYRERTGVVGPRPHSPSVDRIDNSKGYTKDNIRIISWRANRIKADSTIEELELVVKYMKTG